jgi:anti-sigma factor RsiW
MYGRNQMSEHIDRYTLDAYVEQMLPAAECRAVEAHVATCQKCQSRLAAAKQIPAMLYDLPRERPAPELAAQINAAIGTQRRPASAKWIPMLVLAMFAAGLGLRWLQRRLNCRTIRLSWTGWAVSSLTRPSHWTH